jgi:hypothetical protein
MMDSVPAATVAESPPIVRMFRVHQVIINAEDVDSATIAPG